MNNVKILILDDMLGRHQAYRKRYAGHDLTHVETAQVACMALDQRRFDLAHLDHDLRAEHYNDFNQGKLGGVKEVNQSGTGMDVVDFICRQKVTDRPRRVIVHSWNSVRAPEMVRRLQEHGVEATWEMFRPDQPEPHTGA
jgi:hypothetical protein